jgi:hypothetical protein
MARPHEIAPTSRIGIYTLLNQVLFGGLIANLWTKTARKQKSESPQLSCNVYKELR